MKTHAREDLAANPPEEASSPQNGLPERQRRARHRRQLWLWVGINAVLSIIAIALVVMMVRSRW